MVSPTWVKRVGWKVTVLANALRVTKENLGVSNSKVTG